MKYRLLDPEELHEEGDECWIACGGWRPISSLFVGCQVEGITPCRRSFDSDTAQELSRLAEAFKRAGESYALRLPRKEAHEY